MEISDIFVDELSGEGLYAMKYAGEEEDEFFRIFDLWNDPEYVISYLDSNKTYLETDHFNSESIDSLAIKIEREALELERLMMELVSEGIEQTGVRLQDLFRPLNNTDGYLSVHQKSKAVITDHHFSNPILRIYGIRIAPNTYVVTGGAIKLTHEMKNHPDTKQELSKLEKVKIFMVDNGLMTEEEIKIFIHEQ